MSETRRHQQQLPRCEQPLLGAYEDGAASHHPDQFEVSDHPWLQGGPAPIATQHGMRRALVNHYMSAESLLPWFPPSSHGAMGLLDHRDIHLVAGRDPYAWRGTVDLIHPHVRATATAAVPDRRGTNRRYESCMGALK